MKVENKQNYLEFMFDEEEKIIKYECEMILHNEIEGFLSATRKLYNGKTCLMYNIREKISLKRIEEGGKISVQDFISICSSLLGAVCNLKEYSLYSEGIVLDKEFIFIDPREMRCSVVYLPNADSDEPLEVFQKFFRELLFSGSVKLEEGAIVNQIVEILNKPFCDAASLKRELDLLLQSKPVRCRAEQVAAKPQRMREELMKTPQAMPIEKAKMPEASLQHALTEEGKAMPQTPFAEGKLKQHGTTEKKSKPVKEKQKKEKNHSGTLLLSISGVLIVGIAFLWNNGFFAGETGQTDWSALAGAVIAALGIMFFVHKKLKGTNGKTEGKPEKKAKKEKKQKIKKDTSRTKQEKNKPSLRPGKSAHEEMPTPERQEEYMISSTPEPVVYPAQHMNPVEKAADMPDGLGMTEFMDDGEPVYARAYLENAMGERYYLTLEHTRIGKQADKTEIVLQNTKVSRLHAEITQKDGCFYLMDMNSSNGTYLNHNPERLTACADYELISGSVIRFANEEFVFRMER